MALLRSLNAYKIMKEWSKVTFFVLIGIFRQFSFRYTHLMLYFLLLNPYNYPFKSCTSILCAILESFSVLGQAIPAAISASKRFMTADCFKPFLEKLFHPSAAEKKAPYGASDCLKPFWNLNIPSCLMAASNCKLLQIIFDLWSIKLLGLWPIENVKMLQFWNQKDMIFRA